MSRQFSNLKSRVLLISFLKGGLRGLIMLASHFLLVLGLLQAGLLISYRLVLALQILQPLE